MKMNLHKTQFLNWRTWFLLPLCMLQVGLVAAQSREKDTVVNMDDIVVLASRRSEVLMASSALGGSSIGRFYYLSLTFGK